MHAASSVRRTMPWLNFCLLFSLYFLAAASTLATSTAKDVAVAMNSIEFISHLASYKESDDIVSFSQPAKPQHEHVYGGSGSSTAPKDVENFSNNESSWIIYSWRGSKGIKNRSDYTHSTEHLTGKNAGESNPSTLHYQHATTHETVTEYNARKIWFLPSLAEGVRFRETIRVLSISADGQSSTVECKTQFRTGSRWVDCSRVVCKFSSDRLDGSNENIRGERQHQNKVQQKNVKMSLESEVLVWLPLPKAATMAVGKKILSVFESAALDFFHDIYASK